MIEDLPNVPPALVMLARELPNCASWNDMRRRTKGMLRDLRAQSEVFQVENTARTNDRKHHNLFEVHLHGALDLLSGSGCRDLECRIAAASRVARSFGLIADRVWLTDLFTEKFVNFGRATNAKLDDVIMDVIVVTRLMPLIRAGVVRFRSPFIMSCASCADHFARSVELVTDEIIDQFLSEFSLVKRADGGFSFNVGASTEPSMTFHSVANGLKRLPTIRRVAKDWIANEVRSTLWTAREASLTGGAVLSNSHVGMAALLQCDGRFGGDDTLKLLDQRRSLTLPWVTELSVQQVVQLREEASTALPLLREKLCSAMVATDSTVPSANPDAMILQLREQAAEVRGELEAKRRTGARFWKGTFGILGLGLSAYGVAADQAAAAVGGLLPIIQLLISHKTGLESETAKLTSKPGYVLVKAQDILSHADSGTGD